MRQDDIEIVDTEESSHDALAAYYADCTKSIDRCMLASSSASFSVVTIGADVCNML